MSNNTSVGRGPASGGNENHDGDPLNKTLGEKVGQEPPAGNGLIDGAGPDVPAGVPGSRPKPGESWGSAKAASGASNTLGISRSGGEP